MIVAPCTVVTGGPARHVIDQGGVRVIGAHIAQVGPAAALAAAFPDETLWHGHGRVLMPGLVNTHAHLARHLARGLGLRDAGAWERYDRALSAEDVHWAAVAALAEGVRHGVTTVCDLHRSGTCLEHSLAEVARASERVGVRVATGYGVDERDAPAARRAALEESLGFASELRRRRSGRVAATLGVRASSLAGVAALLPPALEAAGEALAVHVDLALDSTPADRWEERQAWQPPARPGLWAHPERAPRSLVAAVHERGDALTSSVAAATALARETPLAWGSDAGLNAPPLPEAPPAGRTPPPGRRGRAAGEATVEALYRRLFVTGAGWAAAHFGARLGRIEPGAPADLVLVDYRPPTEFDAATLPDHLAAGLLRAPVSGVMVAGEILLDNGALLSADEAEVAARARECARRVWERLG